MVLRCSECKKPINPIGETLAPDQYFICETCYESLVVAPGAVVVPRTTGDPVVEEAP